MASFEEIAVGIHEADLNLPRTELAAALNYAHLAATALQVAGGSGRNSMLQPVFEACAQVVQHIVTAQREMNGASEALIAFAVGDGTMAELVERAAAFRLQQGIEQVVENGYALPAFTPRPVSEVRRLPVHAERTALSALQRVADDPMIYSIDQRLDEIVEFNSFGQEAEQRREDLTKLNMREIVK